MRLYRSVGKDVVLLAAANARETFHQVTASELDAKSDLLLAETVTDAEGNFSFDLGEKQDYNGEAFDVDFVCGTGYGKPKPPKKVEDFQFHITTLQPEWREKQLDDNQNVVYFYGWAYCLSAKYWCQILCLLDRWVICGIIRDCATQKPLSGVQVFAFDVDLIEDDPLGSAYTDSTGHFKIVYSKADFSKTIFSWLNIEWPAGPDVYFRVESSSGQVLLAEDRSIGHQSDRENLPNCFCVKLCAKTEFGETPLFTRIGKYNIVSDIDATTGKTTQDRTSAAGIGFGFYHNIQLGGYATKKVPTDLTKPLWYRFQFSKDNGLTWQPITNAHIEQGELQVGSRNITWGGVSGLTQPVFINPTKPASPDDFVPLDAAPAIMPDHILHLDANGWVRVDQVGLDNGFYGPLMSVDTNTIVSGGDATNAGDSAGAAPLVPKNGKLIQFQFQTTDNPLNPASPNLHTQALTAHIFINNWKEVRLLTLTELTAAGTACTPITTNANVHYTADHELMAKWALTATSAAIPIPAGITINILPGGVRGDHGNIDFAVPGTVTPPFTMTMWPSCSYQLSLTTRRKLTDGISNDHGDRADIYFCR